ncbi:MAG: hypothetical protein KF884_13030 [Fimbriimonadaceae bacterium]|nr:hypothetical protein [Fimbriimonadaceae bacterium]QYK58461.1 MAG: hypothetical protein KF884_13030 [Fimbriimonadaceae bacterium]
MTHHEHEPTNPEVVEEDELRELLDRLHMPPELFLDDHLQTKVKITDVVEATSFSTGEVRKALADLREERLTRVLRELEEPLYRVERPGHPPPDPAARSGPGQWHAMRDSILNDLPQVGMVVVRQKKELSPEERQQEQDHHRISNIVLWGLLILMTTLIVSMVIPILAGR